MLHQSAAEKRRRSVANRSHEDRPSVASRDPRPAGRRVVHRRPNAARIRKDLSQRKQDGERGGKLQTKITPEACAEGNSPYRAEPSFPPQRVVVQPSSRAIELNRDCDPAGHARSQAKKPAQAKPIADSEHNRVRHRPSKQSQGTVLSAQQIVRKVETPDYIQASPGDADRGHGVMVHGKILRATETPEHITCASLVAGSVESSVRETVGAG